MVAAKLDPSRMAVQFFHDLCEGHAWLLTMQADRMLHLRAILVGLKFKLNVQPTAKLLLRPSSRLSGQGH